MSNDLSNINIGGGIISSIQNNQLDLPFSNDIYLYTLSIAGIFFNMKNGVKVLENDFLTLRREPDNKYDKYAIEVYTQNNEKLGYIPRSNNRIFARLMDGGKFLFAKVKSVETSSDNKISEIFIRIYLKDI